MAGRVLALLAAFLIVCAVARAAHGGNGGYGGYGGYDGADNIASSSASSLSPPSPYQSNGMCEICSSNIVMPISICPPGFVSIASSPSYPACERCPPGKLCAVEGDRVPPLPCPPGHFCPYGLWMPMRCPAGSICTAERAILWWAPLVLLGVLAALLAGPALLARCGAPASITRAEDYDASGAFASVRQSEGTRVRCAHVSYRAAGRLVLADVCGTLAAGRLTAIIGPSGAGKTTLLSLLRGGIAATSGKVFVDEHETSLASVRGALGFVPQADDTLDPLLSVDELLLFHALCRLPRATHGSLAAARSEVDHAIAVLGLEHVRHVQVLTGREVGARSLSGGERRRTSIATAVVARPRVLLLDEATTGLDSIAARAVVESLRRMARSRNVTVAATIHQPSERLLCLFDDVVVLAAGRVAYWGPVADAVSFFTAQGARFEAGVAAPDVIVDFVTRAGAAAPLVAVNGCTAVAAPGQIALGPRPVARAGALFPWQFALQVWRQCLRVKHSLRSLAGTMCLFAAAGTVVGLTFLGPKYVLPLPQPIVARCPEAVSQLTAGQKYNQPCSTNWPAEETQGLFCLYCCMCLGVLAAAYSVHPLGAFKPSYWRETAAGISWLAHCLAVFLVDSAVACALAFAFLALYAPLANPWGSFGEYWALTSMYIWCVFGLGYVCSAGLGTESAAIVCCLTAMVGGVFSGLAFQATPAFTFFFSEGLFRAEAEFVIAHAGASVPWVASYARTVYGYSIGSGTIRKDLAMLALWGAAARLVACVTLRLRHWSKQK